MKSDNQVSVWLSCTKVPNQVASFELQLVYPLSLYLCGQLCERCFIKVFTGLQMVKALCLQYLFMSSY